MISEKHAFEIVRGMLDRGECAREDANAEIVRLMGISVIRGRIPLGVRRELMASVKSGRIGRIAKTGPMPEVFFHPNAIFRAKDARNAALAAHNAALSRFAQACSVLRGGDGA